MIGTVSELKKATRTAIRAFSAGDADRVSTP